MKKSNLVLVISFIFLLLNGIDAIGKSISAEPPKNSDLNVLKTYGKLPLAFEVNKGQTHKEVSFLSRGIGYNLFLTPTETVLVLQRPDESKTGKKSVVSFKLVGANPYIDVKGLDELPGKSSYFVGDDPKKWITDVSSYNKVKYQDVYAGVDLIYYGKQQQLEYDFIVLPGSDPKIITLEFEGADKLEVNAKGDLVLQTQSGEIVQHAPVIYQDIHGIRKKVDGGYQLKNTNQVSFRVAAYDKSKPLVIDPILVYSTHLGGDPGGDVAKAIAVDTSGNIYITGFTQSLSFPTLNAIQPTHGGGTLTEAFVAKIDPEASALVYSTYLGGNGGEQGLGISVDSSGNAYITGVTNSTDFPTTVNAVQQSKPGATVTAAAFVTKIDTTGSSLVYSTYLGGSDGPDAGEGIAVDGAGHAFIAGHTNTSDFPTINAIKGSNYVGNMEAFVTKIDSSGSSLIYSTYLGGSGYDQAYGIDIDGLGNAYITGTTGSIDFPTANPIQSNNSGGADTFVAKIDSAGSSLIYSTYLGGSAEDGGGSISSDILGNAYVTGFTASTDFPTINAIQGSLAGSYDAFVTKIDSAGSALIYSTYLGGNGRENWGATRGGIAVDSSGDAFVTGLTESTDFPTEMPVQASNSRDAFVTALDPTGAFFLYSTQLGGDDQDIAQGIAVDRDGNAYIAGNTDSINFPVINPLQPAHQADAFVSVINLVNVPPIALADGPFVGLVGSPLTLDGSASFDPEGQSLSFTWDFGDGSPTLVTTDSIVEHTYVDAGIFDVTIVVSDDENDSAPFVTNATIGFVGGGQRSDVDAFLGYANPTQKSTELAPGATNFDLTIIYGPEIDEITFQVSLNGNPFAGFVPVPGTVETVSVPLSVGRNTILFMVDGVRSDGRTATDRDRLTFIVQ